MIQELFGSHATSTTLINNGAERNSSILSSSSTSSNGGGGSSSGRGSSNSTSTTTAEKNLRCPRCDSANTKFCYYNNYNLTQPRHFCKTCRRYWTKGGALRNVPIGGGCRKNKATIANTITTNKYLKSVVSDQILDFHDQYFQSSSSPILWTPPHNPNSPILTLLRPTTTTSHQNPNNPCNVTPSSSLLADYHHDHSVEPGARPLSSDSLIGKVPINLGRLAQNNYGFNVNSGSDSSGLQELYQRLKSLPSSSPSPSASVMVLNNVGYSSSAGGSAAGVGGDQMGNWNNAVLLPSWSAADHIPTTHGSTTAFP